MKGHLFVFAILLGLLSLSSCTKTLYSHSQVLQTLHTKDDVLKQFGKADETHPGVGFEQWVYNMDKQSPPLQDPTPDSLKYNAGILKTHADSLSADSVQNITFDKYAKYIKFNFDPQGNMIGYKAEGADLRRSKKDSFGKSLLTITGGIVLASALIALELYNNGAFDQ